MKSDTDLKYILQEINHKGYPSYKRTAGSYGFKAFILNIDHVQGDPFASPSNVSVCVSAKMAAFPKEYYDKDYRRVALEDYLLRIFSKALSEIRLQNAGSGKSGQIYTSRPGQEILKRTAMSIDEKTGAITARLEVGFPARGRTVMTEPLEKIFFVLLPKIIERCFFYENADTAALKEVIELAEDEQALRESLNENNLVAFIANGSILPRESGISQRPMKGALAFKSPAELEYKIMLPHRGEIRGMGIKKGIFLIVGGGYHGKSTLLLALERGVYNHIKGDGREFVVTDEGAMKIRSEDGRSVKDVDVSLFINDLPNKKDTKHFTTEDASGSTSQAANVVEAMEMGCKLLLIDEDTSATNFMVRDELMRSVVSDQEESITPFLLRMRQMYESSGISTILVAGSSGCFFKEADTVIQMDEYVPGDVTKKAKAAYENAGIMPQETQSGYNEPNEERIPLQIREWAKPQARVKSKVLAVDGFLIDKENVDLRGLSQLVDKEQTKSLALILKLLAIRYFNGKRTITAAVDALYKDIEDKGLEMLCGKTIVCGLAMPRRQEIFAMVNRVRKLTLS